MSAVAQHVSKDLVPGMGRVPGLLTEWAPLLTSRFTYRLTGRAGLLLQGEEILKFLQGMVTNDVYKLQKGQYTLALDAKSRILFDLHLYKRNDEEIILDVEKSAREALMHHLKKYRLRSRVLLSPLEGYVQVSSHEPSAPSICYRDARGEYMGYRQWIEGDVSEAKEEAKDGAYIQRRILSGIPEGSETSGRFLQECNGDKQHGVDYEKGCYLGQEMVIRTYHTGQVRKRVLPFIANQRLSGDLNLEHDNARALRGTSILCTQDRIGLALLRLPENEHPTEVQGYRINGIPITAYHPLVAGQ